MKKSLALCMLALTAVITSCSDSSNYRIGVSQCSGGAWREKVNNEMLAAQHLYEHAVKVSIACAYDDTERQIQQIDSLADSGIDLLVIAPNESAPLSAVLQRVRQRGIPVVCFDRRVADQNCTAFIGGSNVEAGHAIGVNVVDVAHGLTRPGRKPRVLEVTALMSSSPARERHQGFSQALKGHDELEYLCRQGDWSSEETYRIVKQLILEGRQPDIVFCHNDGMATGAYKAVVETQTADHIQIFGIDGMPGEGLDYVQFGHQTASYVYPTGGSEIIRLALDILTGRPYKRENILPGILVVRENAWSIAQTSSELMRQNKDLVTIQDKLEDYLGLYNLQRKLLWGLAAGCLALAVGCLLTWRAFIQMRRVVRQRQTMHEEQTLFYTNPDSRTLRQVFETEKEALPTPRSQDSIFAETLNEAIRQNMSNPNLKMDDLGNTVGLSRVQLYRKVKAITGLTPVELLRQMRLQQGYVLLATTNKTVQEIAYEVGFGTPGYFSKCFRQQYGKYPMELRSEQS